MTAKNRSPHLNPSARLISLTDAALSGGVKVNDILEAGVQLQSGISLLFECPPGQTVALMPSERDVKHWSAVGVADLFRTPEYLVLKPELCSLLKSKPYVDVFDATSGYRTSGYTNIFWQEDYQFLSLQELRACDAGKSEVFPVEVVGKEGLSALNIPWVRWTFRSGNSITPHRVRIEDLFIIVKDFYKWMKWDSDENPEDFFLYAKGEDREDGYDFKSPMLIKMCEAAYKLWNSEKLIPEEPETHPANEAVIKWLLDSNVGFTKTSAENAASIIKPGFANKAGAPIKKK